MITRYFTHAPCVPAFSPHVADAALRPVRMPIGGTATGARFPAGTVIGCVGGTATNEVWTIAINGATGTVTFGFTAYTAYSTTFAVGATTAVVQTALETIFGTGNVTVTGTPGTSYTVTHGGVNAAALFGGLLAVSATAGTPTVTRTTPGTSGANQYAAYDNSAVPVARAVLKWEYASDPQGGRVTEQGATGQPYSPVAYFAGYFLASALTGFDSSALADPRWTLVQGGAYTETGAVVGLGV